MFKNKNFKKIKPYIVNFLKDRDKVFSALVYILLFIFLIHPYTDYDWGWHYRLGEYFVKNGKILFEDPFSWTMPGYKWANHEWLYDPFHYLIFTAFSFQGMIFAGSITSFLWFYLAIKKYNLSFIKKGILALFFANLVGGVVWQGLRVQMVGTLFIAVLMYVLPNIILKPQRKYLIFLPFMFLLWANIHGYFILGLVIFALAIFGQIIAELLNLKQNSRGHIFIPKNLFFSVSCFALCFLATFVNPFTYHLYLEGLRHLKNPLLQYILEWIPFQLTSQFSFVFFLYTFIIAALFIYRRKVSDIPYLFVFLFVLYYSLTARRYVSVYAVVTLPIIAMFLKDIPFKIEKYKATAFLFLIFCVVSLEIGLFRRIPNYHIFTYNFTDYCGFGSGCSEYLVSYLKKNPPKGRGLNFYDWGGYFIGRGVPAKLFIDGRMHLWKNDKTSFQPFLVYQRMYYDRDYELFKKYNFDWLILEKSTPLYAKIRETKDLGLWSIGYEDNKAVYLKRIRNL